MSAELKGFPAAQLGAVGASVADAHTLLDRRVKRYLQTLSGFFALMAVGGWVKSVAFGDLMPSAAVAETVKRGSLVLSVVAVILCAAWLFIRRTQRPIRTLQGVETLGTLVCVFALTHILAISPTDVVMAAPAEVGVLMMSVLVLVVRAALVPSSATRTMFVGLLVSAELTMVSLARVGWTPVPAVHASTWAYVLSWGLVFTAATVIVSRVIYGLHKQVRQAVQLGNYTLDAKLGEGGMGEVYLAHHALLRRPTAIKLLPPEKAGENTIRRFEREVREASRLVHPNTVEVYDFGRTPDGVFYYAMEYLDGLNLEELVALEGPQPPGRVIYVIAQVAHALEHAHAQKLIHRDIKPANIVVCDRGGVADMAKVVDFGLVKPIEAPDDLVLTGTNTITGTPAYMAPESLTKPDQVDGRADIYGLGAVAYFMLTGEPVFGGATMVEVCSHHLHSVPVPPSRRSLAPIPAELERVVLKCLEKDPAARFAGGESLREALLACASASDWSMKHAARWWAAHRGEVQHVMEQKQAPVSGGRGALEARLSA